MLFSWLGPSQGLKKKVPTNKKHLGLGISTKVHTRPFFNFHTNTSARSTTFLSMASCRNWSHTVLPRLMDYGPSGALTNIPPFVYTSWREKSTSREKSPIWTRKKKMSLASFHLCRAALVSARARATKSASTSAAQLRRASRMLDKWWLAGSLLKWHRKIRGA